MFCYILRGISGSGKSTLARVIADNWYNNSHRIHSTDDLFINQNTGEYEFNPDKLSLNHRINFVQFCASIDDCYELVILDNTNSKKEHYYNYKMYAEAKGYQVFVIQLEHPPIDIAVKRNMHSVPEHTIKRMLENWEY